MGLLRFGNKIHHLRKNRKNGFEKKNAWEILPPFQQSILETVAQSQCGVFIENTNGSWYLGED